jgi:predicted transcriptional regulator
VLPFDAADRVRLSTLAAAKKRTPHYLMKEAILDYVKKEESRQSFITAAQASFEHDKQTGLHITLDEFSGWVEQVQQAPA